MLFKRTAHSCFTCSACCWSSKEHVLSTRGISSAALSGPRSNHTKMLRARAYCWTAVMSVSPCVSRASAWNALQWQHYKELSFKNPELEWKHMTNDSTWSASRASLVPCSLSWWAASIRCSKGLDRKAEISSSRAAESFKNSGACSQVCLPGLALNCLLYMVLYRKKEMGGNSMAGCEAQNTTRDLSPSLR